MRLAGKRCVVTGAAGGIGSEAARAFVAEGALVGLLDRPSSALDALAEELGVSAHPLPTDLTDETEVAAAFAGWADRFGGLDALYCCAGIQLHGEDGPVDRTPLEVWHRTFAVNATGVFLTLRHALPIIVASGGGSVIVCGSPTALTMSGAGYSAYASSKAAAMALARVVAADYGAYGVRANVVVPGTTETPLIATLLEDAERRSALEGRSPLGRLARPEDLAGIAVYLASDESAYATASTFAVDGGLVNR